MRVSDKLWTNWNEHPMRLWQTQLNFAVWCASSACGVSSAHLNYTKHPIIGAVCCFHVYYLWLIICSKSHLFIFMLYLFIFMPFIFIFMSYLFIFMLFISIFMLFYIHIHTFLYSYSCLFIFIFMLFYIHIHVILIHIHALLHSYSCYTYSYSCFFIFVFMFFLYSYSWNIFHIHVFIFTFMLYLYIQMSRIFKKKSFMTKCPGSSIIIILPFFGKDSSIWSVESRICIPVT